ncbi:MAG TPA: heavy-metal-associated domain-containing protein [Prolixibacteraceae bacterium]|jgi:copper chaperone CopZ
MKRVLFIAFMSFVLSACSPKQHSVVKENTPATMVEVNLKIEGMTCTDCEASIKKGVTELAGIDSISANYKDSTAFVRFDSAKTNLKEISEAIAKRGYEVK